MYRKKKEALLAARSREPSPTPMDIEEREQEYEPTEAEDIDALFKHSVSKEDEESFVLSKVNERALRFLLAGKNYGDFDIFNRMEKNKNKMTKHEWRILAKKVYEAVDEIASEELFNRRKQLQGKAIHLMVDCRWGTVGFNAKEATVSGFDVETKQLIIVQNMFREGKHKNCDLDAKAMEGQGVELICKKLKEENITVHTLLHDNDASSINHVREYFPDVKEQLCNNHTAKSIRKRMGKDKNPDFKSIPKFEFRVWKAVKYILSHCSTKEQAKERAEIYIQHWQGNHEKCTHAEATQKYS